MQAHDLPRAIKRRRLSSSAAEVQSAILEPGSIKINVSGAYIIPHSPPTTTCASSASSNSPLSRHHSSAPSSGSSTPSATQQSYFDAANGATEEPAFEHDERDIRLPNHTALVSHVAADIGGSLAKVVYFAPEPVGSDDAGGAGTENGGGGGRLHFLRFETERIDACIEFLRNLQDEQRALAAARRLSSNATKKRKRLQGRDGAGTSAEDDNTAAETTEQEAVPADEREQKLCVVATGGGAFKYYDRIRDRLGVHVIREDEMECLIQGLDFFITQVPREVFTYDDEADDTDNPMVYPEPQAGRPVYPYLLVNIGSGVSMIKVSGPSQFQRIGGTSLGGGTLWGLLSLLTGARTFDDMLAMSERGDNAAVDLLVGDIYGAGNGYEKIGLSEKTIASSFGKVFKMKRRAERDAEDGKWLSNGDGDSGVGLSEPGNAAAPDEIGSEEHTATSGSAPAQGVGDGRMFRSEDISRSLLYAVSNNIGQIAYLQSEKHDLERIYFGGSFIRGHLQTMHTLSFAIKFWSKGAKQAYFLRHEGYLGAVGAFLKRQPANWGRRASVDPR